MVVFIKRIKAERDKNHPKKNTEKLFLQGKLKCRCCNRAYKKRYLQSGELVWICANKGTVDAHNCTSLFLYLSVFSRCVISSITPLANNSAYTLFCSASDAISASISAILLFPEFTLTFNELSKAIVSSTTVFTFCFNVLYICTNADFISISV